MTPAACGTYSGYQRHNRQGEETCEACKAAAAYMRNIRSRSHWTQESAKSRRRINQALLVAVPVSVETQPSPPVVTPETGSGTNTHHSKTPSAIGGRHAPSWRQTGVGPVVGSGKGRDEPSPRAHGCADLERTLPAGSDQRGASLIGPRKLSGSEHLPFPLPAANDNGTRHAPWPEAPGWQVGKPLVAQEPRQSVDGGPTVMPSPFPNRTATGADIAGRP